MTAATREERPQRPWNEPEPVLRTFEVAVHLDVDQATVWRLLKSGELRGVRIGRQWRVPVSALNEFVSGGKPGGAA